MKRSIVVSLFGGLLLATTGCCLLDGICCYRPCVARAACADGCDGDCGGGCGSCCGPFHHPVRTVVYGAAARIAGRCDGCCDGDCGRPCGRCCGPVCGGCGGGPCGDCCGDGCGERCWNRGPLTWIFALFTPPCWCGRGCGQRYWGDFYGDPPDCWDPCDCYGNYTGGGVVHGGCRTCGHPVGGVVDGEVYSEAPVPSGRRMDGVVYRDAPNGRRMDGEVYRDSPSGRRIVSQRMSMPPGGKIFSQNDRVVDTTDNAAGDSADGSTDYPVQRPHRASRQQ